MPSSYPEPKDFADFYSRVLGFRVSDWIQDWFVFMRCGPDHHTINFVRGKRTQMHHVAFELKDWPQVQSACDFLGSNKFRAYGVRAATVRAQYFHLSPQSRRPDHRDVHRARQMLDENLGYFEPQSWHRDHPQVPKVWGALPNDIWGPPPTADYVRQRE